MRYILGIGLLLLNVLLIYVLYKNIQEPIAFQKIKQDRGDVVVDKLKEIRTTQEIYRAITGEFASSFDTLKYVLTNDSIPFEVLEQLDERNDVFKKTVTYTAAIDSINSLGINLDNLQFVPYTDNKSAFDIAADTITYQLMFLLYRLVQDGKYLWENMQIQSMQNMTSHTIPTIL